MSNKNKTKKLHIKTGDNVMIIAGDHKGELALIKKIFPNENKAILEGMNMVKRHIRPSAQVPGGIVEKESPIHISNLMLVDSNNIPSRINRESKDNKSVRVSKKTKEVIE
jgi:large subunit ribosomal protein L24